MPPSPQDLPIARRISFWRDAIEYGEPLVHVATDDKGIVGFVGYGRSRDPESKATTGEIWALFVLPEHWDKSVGLALWDGAREGLLEEGCTEVTAWIPLLNDRAMRFAELAGFKRELASARTATHGSVKLEEIRLRRALS
ncbi:MAG: GNAT family N-acetyltransferase [Ramlibacter sp.]|nr:GNAT family N-acetyltransferase [Ramlibacter sp.]